MWWNVIYHIDSSLSMLGLMGFTFQEQDFIYILVMFY